MADDRIDILRKVTLFESLSDKELEAVARATKERRYDTGDVIVSEGDTGVGFFVVAEGTARVEASGKRVGQLTPGDSFGEVALLDDARPPQRHGHRRVADEALRPHRLAVHAPARPVPRTRGQDRSQPGQDPARDAGTGEPPGRRLIHLPAGS